MITRNDLLADKLQSYFSQYEKETPKEILNQISLFIYSMEGGDSDLYTLAKLLPDESLQKVISYYDGAQIKVPTKEEFRNCLLIAITFFLHDVHGYSWTKIREILNIPEADQEMLNTVSLGKKLSTIKNELRRQLILLLDKVGESDLKRIIKEENLDGSRKTESTDSTGILQQD